MTHVTISCIMDNREKATPTEERGMEKSYEKFHCGNTTRPCWSRGLGQCEFCYWQVQIKLVAVMSEKEGQSDVDKQKS